MTSRERPLYEQPMTDRPEDIEWLISGITHLTRLAHEYREAKLDMYRQSSPLFYAEINEEDIPRGRIFTQELLECGLGILRPDFETAINNPTDPFNEAAQLGACDDNDSDLYAGRVIYEGYYPDDDDDDIGDTPKYI